VKGGSGVFDVFVDDRLVFSKKSEGRFPTEDEILDKLP
jgi:selT/selW/selH-like putative selenoprotein